MGKALPRIRHRRRPRHGQLPCLPSGSTPPDPQNLKIPVLLLGVQNDPIVGNEGVAAVAATIINSGAANRRVMWHGVGHGASIYSTCAVPPLLSYLGTGKVPETDTYCPA